MTENEKYIFDYFMTGIKSGFQLLDDIIDETLEVVEDEGWEKEISEDWVEKNVECEYEKHKQESETWQHPTDTEKLILAFNTLRKEKIIALHNAGYTQSEAIEDVSDMWQRLEDKGVQPVGYCYYHEQDLKRAINGGGLMIGFYGKKEKNDKEAIIIGHKVVAALEAAGLEVIWNKTASKRIEIPNFEWRNICIFGEETDNKWRHKNVLEMMAEQ